jgi:hypothetical protein
LSKSRIYRKSAEKVGGELEEIIKTRPQEE